MEPAQLTGHQRSARDFAWLGATGEMSDRIRAHDWAQTPVGPPSQWPQSLKTALAICLDSRFPMFVWWGPELTVFYNDAYSVIAKPNKHPQFLGRPAWEMWGDIWDVIGPMVQQVVTTGVATWSEDLPLFMVRKGFLEETYFSFSYSAARDDDGTIRGMFCACHETTGRVVNERRMKVLRELGTREAHTEREAAAFAVEALALDREDIPFALSYLVDSDGTTLRLAGAAGLEPGSTAAPRTIDLSQAGNSPWPVAEALQRRNFKLIRGLRAHLAEALPREPWPEQPDCAAVVPLSRSQSEAPAGVLILGTSPRLEFDESYRGFFHVATEQISTRIANTRLKLEAEIARERLHRLFMEAPVGICVLEGREHRYTLVNPSYYSIMFGKDRHFVGQTIREALPELEGQGYYELLDRVFETGESFNGNELPASLRQADGTLKQLYVNFVYQATRDAYGQVDGILVVAYDVTEQVLARRRVEEALHARDQFLSVASHELKTPITSLQLQTQSTVRQFALKGASGVDPDRLKKLLDQSTRSLQRLSRLVDDMLDISRITTGKLTFQREDFDLSVVAHEVVEHMTSQVQAAGTSVTVESATPVTGHWDRFRIEQVITNLLTNAVRYGEGSPIRVRVWREQNHAILTVRDQGPGIAPENQDRIFNRFERAIDANAISGLGLGLFICREIVERHGGTIHVESELGHGSKFVMKLPATSS